jgi:hypothetical protein
MTNEKASQANLQDLTGQGHHSVKTNHPQGVVEVTWMSRSGPVQVSLERNQLIESCRAILRELGASPELQIVDELRKIENGLQGIAGQVSSVADMLLVRLKADAGGKARNE